MDLGNSLGWRAPTVATYCASRLWQLAQKNMTKHGKLLDENRCTDDQCILDRVYTTELRGQFWADN